MENKNMKELDNNELEMIYGGSALFQEVQGMLASKLGIAKDSIRLQSHIIEDLGADSLDVVDVLQSVADKFNVEVNRPYGEFKSVADICKLARPGDSRNI